MNEIERDQTEGESIDGATGQAAAELVITGLPVFDRNDVRVGVVAEHNRLAFRIDAPWDGELWIGYDVIASALPHQYVQLMITCEQLDHFNIPPSVAAA